MYNGDKAKELKRIKVKNWLELQQIIKQELIIELILHNCDTVIE